MVTTIPSEFWMTLASAIWWGVIVGIISKGLAWIGFSFAAICKADNARLLR